MRRDEPRSGFLDGGLCDALLERSLLSESAIIRNSHILGFSGDCGGSGLGKLLRGLRVKSTLAYRKLVIIRVAYISWSSR